LDPNHFRAPTVAALRKWAADVVDAELLQLDRRLPELDAGVRAELTRTVRRVIDKLLLARSHGADPGTRQGRWG